MSFTFFLTSLLICVSPGTGVLYTVATGLTRGRRASVIAAFGCTLGIVPHMAAAIFGLTALLQASGVAFQAFKYLGVAYLVFMAWNTLREKGALNVSGKTAARSAAATVVEAILINLLNPKLSMFFLAFLPQFVEAIEPHPLERMLMLSAIFMAMTFVVFLAYGFFAAAWREHVLTRPKVLVWLRRAFASGFLALGARLAFAER